MNQQTISTAIVGNDVLREMAINAAMEIGGNTYVVDVIYVRLKHLRDKCQREYDAALADLQQGEGVTVDESELKPCPFCGKNATIHQHEQGDWLAYCPDVVECGTEGWYCNTRDEAVARWNQRAATPPPATVALPVAYLGTLETCVDLASNMRGGDTEEEFARWQAECEPILAWLHEQMPPPAQRDAQDAAG